MKPRTTPLGEGSISAGQPKGLVAQRTCQRLGSPAVLVKDFQGTVDDVAVVKSHTEEKKALEANNGEARGKNREKQFFHAISRIPGAIQGELRPFRASPDFRTEIISPGRTHLDREQPRPHRRMTRMMRCC